MRHGKLPERDMWTTAGIWIVGLTAAAMSWTGWFLLAVMCGWPPILAAFLPLAVDVYVVTSARVWLRLPWVSDTTNGNGHAASRLDYGGWGADLVISGDSHFYERLVVSEFPTSYPLIVNLKW